MENLEGGNPTNEDLGRQGISQSFMDAMNPQEAEPAVETPTEPVAEVTPVAEEPVQEQQEAPAEEVVEIGEVTPEPTLEIVEEAPVPVTKSVPEGLEKLAEFIQDGGTLEQYVELNKDVSDLDDNSLVKDYYKKSRPHLDAEEVDYLISKKFTFDADTDDEDTVREKKIALKEELYKAKQFHQEYKDKYYTEIKSGLSTENSEFERVKEENAKVYQEKQEQFFEGFKGYDFQLGENKPKVRYKIDNADAHKQSNTLDKALGGFLDSNGQVTDFAGMQKFLFAGQNADKIATMFYDQGYAMAVKELNKNSKNTDFTPAHHEPTSTNKLAPGQAREIKNPKENDGRQRVKLRSWK